MLRGSKRETRPSDLGLPHRPVAGVMHHQDRTKDSLQQQSGINQGNADINLITKVVYLTLHYIKYGHTKQKTLTKHV